jgi:hypothetical protein
MTVVSTQIKNYVFFLIQDDGSFLKGDECFQR